MLATKRVLPCKREPIHNSLETLSAESSDVEELRMESEIFETTDKTRIPGLKRIQVKDPLELQKIVSSIMNENKQKDEEIKSLRRQLLEDTTLNQQLEQQVNEEVAHKKIRELAKRLKRLTVLYEKERTKNVTLKTQLYTTEKKEPVAVDSDVSKFQTEIRLLRDKHTVVSEFDQAMRKIEDERMQNQNLQKEIRNLHKILVKEVGDGYSVEKLLKADSTAKGRTEQIALLKEKIKQLNQKLHLAHSEDSSKPPSRLSASDHNGLYKQELTKRKELEKMQQEITQLKQKIADQKTKFDGLVARNKILEVAKRDSKKQICALLKKAEDDDRYIKALKEELKRMGDFMNSDKLKIQLAEKDQQLKKLVKENNRETVLESRQSIREDSYERLLESLQLEIQMVREAKEQLESKLAEEHSLNILLKTRIDEMEEQLKRKGEKQQRTDNVKELSDRLDILQDENQTLKLSLQAALDAKQQDLRMYQLLLDNTRKSIETE